MLAHKSIIPFAVLVAAFAFGVASTATDAQQPPSQRYQPVAQNRANAPAVHPYSRAQTHSSDRPMGRQHVGQTRPSNSAPPSVHVAPTHARQLSTAGNPGTGYRFSDSSSSQRPAGNRYRTPPRNHPAAQYNDRGRVMQTSYAWEIDSTEEPAVPAILAGANRKQQPTTQTPAAPVFKSPRQSVAPRQSTGGKAGVSQDDSSTSSPARFSNQMKQLRGGAPRAELRGTPRIAPQEFSNSQKVQRDFDDLRERVAQRQRDGQRPKAQPQSAVVRRDRQVRGAAASNVTAKTSTQPVTGEGVRSESASEFISKLSSSKSNTNGFGKSNSSNTVFESDSQVRPAGGTTTVQNVSPATMHVPEGTGLRDAGVRKASASMEDVAGASITLSAPSISVETFGPQTVGVNKSAIYKVVVTNASNTTAERIVVGIDVPVWIDIESVNLTAGNKEITDGKQQARLVWAVDQVPGNGSQTITITAVPRKAEPFDLGIEWTLAPRTGHANIRVTQPKLDMSIVGPDEVQYGEQALYHVTVRNPGTGTAENVVVMLPEALGGERATLGDILPGGDKKFQVELLARTAGQLDLVATAVAEGDLEVAASRKLTVRRANLGISIAGPSLKYAGSVGQFVVNITNNGDATANDIIAAMALPRGVQFLGGIESFKLIDGGLRWQVGSLDPGQTREYNVSCQLDASGDLQLEVGAQGKGDLQAASACVTKVETVADLVLTVRDPKGPLPTGQSTRYEISIRNRGSRSAKGVDVVMQFSEGIEPKSAKGMEHRIVTGQVLFAPISQIEPGQEVTFNVDAEAFKPGTHVFRAQLVCKESDSREIAEGTTKFFGDEIRTAQRSGAESTSQDFGGGIRR